MVDHVGLVSSRTAGIPSGQKALAPDHRLPASSIYISQAHIEVVIQRGVFRANTQRDISGAGAQGIHTALRQRNRAGRALVGAGVEGPGVIMATSFRFDTVSDISGERCLPVIGV